MDNKICQNIILQNIMVLPSARLQKNKQKINAP